MAVKEQDNIPRCHKGAHTPNEKGRGRHQEGHRQARDGHNPVFLLAHRPAGPGGPPLMVKSEILENYISRLRAIPHLDIIRIGTRVPVTLPMRVTEELVSMLKKYHPLYISIHFSHPREITPEVAKACTLLADAGIPLGSHTVLLKGVHDRPATMKKLMQ